MAALSSSAAGEEGAGHICFRLRTSLQQHLRTGEFRLNGYGCAIQLAAVHDGFYPRVR